VNASETDLQADSRGEAGTIDPSASASVGIFVINLARDVARREFMQAQLAELQLACTFVPAVLGRELDSAALGALYDAQRNASSYHSPLAAGEIGCYASHLQVWRRVLEMPPEQQFALVLEDDMALAEHLPQLLQSILQQTGVTAWHMIKLCGRKTEPVHRRYPLAAGAVPSELVRYVKPPSFTGAYLLSRAGAAVLLKTRARFSRPVDIDLRFWWENQLQLFGLLPYPAHEAPVGAVSSVHKHDSQQRAGYRWRRTKFNVVLNVLSVYHNWRTPERSPLI
jgi:glycosyl transferase, family 25